MALHIKLSEHAILDKQILFYSKTKYASQGFIFVFMGNPFPQPKIKDGWHLVMSKWELRVESRWLQGVGNRFNQRSSKRNEFHNLQSTKEGFIKLVPKSRKKPSILNQVEGNRLNPEKQCDLASNFNHKNPSDVHLLIRSKNIVQSPKFNKVPIVIKNGLIKQTQRLCKQYQLFARWKGLGNLVEYVAEWFWIAFRGQVGIVILSEDFFYIGCNKVDLRNKLLVGDCPKYRGIGFNFFEWQSFFNPKKMSNFILERTIILLDLPVKLISEEIVRKIGNKLGR